MPVGVPIEVAKKYPKADAGNGCVTNDIPLRERQQEYARRYNEKMFRLHQSETLEAIFECHSERSEGISDHFSTDRRG